MTQRTGKSGGKAKTAAKGKTSAPARGKTAAPARGKATAPARGKATAPARGKPAAAGKPKVAAGRTAPSKAAPAGGRAAATRGAKPRAAARTERVEPRAASRAERTERVDTKKPPRAAPAQDPRPARARELEDVAPETPRTDTSGLEGAMAALTVALDKKAVEPVLLDVREMCSYCNYQLVVSGRSDRQVDAISEGIQVSLKTDGRRPLSSEGLRSGQWALLDYGDFVVHVFHHPLREHYDLEGLWHEAPRVPIEVPADARIGIDEAY